MPSDLKLNILNNSNGSIFTIHETSGITTSLDFFTTGFINILRTDGNTNFNNQVFLNNTNGNSATFYGNLEALSDINLLGSLNVTSASNLFNLQIIDTTDTTSVSSATSLIVNGGANFQKNVIVGQNMTVNGNLNVLGTQTIINSETLAIEDNFLIINAGPSMTKDAGYLINRYQTENNTGAGDVIQDTPSYIDILPLQNGVNSNTIVLSTSASSIVDFYKGNYILSGSEVRLVTAYDPLNYTLTVNTSFLSQPLEGQTVNFYNRPYVVSFYDESDDKYILGYTVSDSHANTVTPSDFLKIELGSIQGHFPDNTIGSIITTGGNVGIKTTSPQFELDVNGQIKAIAVLNVENINAAYLQARNTVTNRKALFGVDDIDLADIEQGSVFIGSDHQESNLLFAPNKIERMRINATTGHVGINNPFPEYFLDVDGTTAFRDSTFVLSEQNGTGPTAGGALTVMGDAGIGGDLFVGGTIFGSANASSSFAFLTLTATEESVSLTSGALVSFGGLTVQSSSVALSATEGASILTAGGVAIGKNLIVGTSLNVLGDTTFGNINFTGELYQDGLLYVSSQWQGTSGILTYNGTGGTLLVGIGTTNPEATLQVSGGILVTNFTSSNNILLNVTSNNLFANNATLSNVNISIQTISNSIINNNTVNNLLITNGLNSVFDSNTLGNIITTGGNVAIGTISPLGSLDVISVNTFGNIFLGNNLQNRKLVLFNGTSNNHEFNGLGANSASLRYQVAGISNSHDFYAAENGSSSNHLLRISGNGNIGIGTTSPTSSLHINTTNSNGQLYLGNVVQNKKFVLYDTLNNNHEFYGFGINLNSLRYQVDNIDTSHDFFAATSATSSNHILRIAGNGNVGIGTTNPLSQLDVRGSVVVSNSEDSVLRLNTDIDGVYIQSGNTFGSSVAPIYFTNYNGDIKWMTIQTNGNIGINTVTPAHRLDVNGGINALFLTSGNILVSNTSNSVGIGSGGSLTVLGGASVSNDLYVGGNLFINGASSNFFSGNTIIGSFTGTGVYTISNIPLGTTTANTDYRIIGSLRTTTNNTNVYSISFKNLTTTSFDVNILRLDALGSGFTDPNLTLSWAVYV